VRAASACQQPVQRPIDELDVGNATDQRRRNRLRLARGQTGHDRDWRPTARWNLRDLRPCCVAEVWSDGSWNLLALPDRRRPTTDAAFGDIQVSIGSKAKSARVVEACRVRRDGNGPAGFARPRMNGDDIGRFDW
jgi:hypothetical protein